MKINVDKYFFSENSVQKNIFIFLHIEKTAGTTLTNFFRGVFDDDEKVKWLGYQGFLKEFEKNPEFLSNLRLICGHFDFGIHNFFRNRIPIYFSVVREPLERVISWYFYQKRTKRDPEYKITNELSLEDWVEFNIKNPKYDMFRNFQSRRLFGSQVPNCRKFYPVLERHISNFYDLIITDKNVDNFIETNKHLSTGEKEFKNMKVSNNKQNIELDEELKKKFYKLNIVDCILYKKIIQKEKNFDLSLL